MTPSELEQARFEALAAELGAKLLERRRRLAAAGGERVRLERAVEEIVDTEAAILSPAARDRLVALILRDTVGLGPLEALLDDASVEEVMVNGHDRVYVERGGRIEPTEIGFRDEQALRDTIERILAAAGRRVDELSPMADARLADGSRVNVIIPPLAIDGPVLSIRRFGTIRPDLETLIASGSLDEASAAILVEAIEARLSLVVCGGTGSGKTTLLNALSTRIAAGERIVTIEDAAELQLAQPHVVRLEGRPASIEGRGRITIRDLLRNALRMRPDRIIIGEVRGAEALDLLAAMNTGHAGSLSTIHANSCEEAMSRLETLALMAGVGLPHTAIREQIGRGIDAVVRVDRDADGTRRVVSIAAVEHDADRGYRVHEVWPEGGGT